MLYHQAGIHSAVLICVYSSKSIAFASHFELSSVITQLELDLLYLRHYLLTSCALPCQHLYLYRARYSSTSTGKGNIALKSFLLIVQFSIELTRKLHSVSNRNLLSPSRRPFHRLVCLYFIPQNEIVSVLKGRISRISFHQMK